jgi:GntR family transcriptional regulator/MocR family aminotransferase
LTVRYGIDRKRKKAAYLQLYDQMRDEIVNGIYGCGMKIPSKRTLAEETGMSVITVEHAYALLCDEGYIEPRERSGYFVCYRREDSFPVGGEDGKASSGRVPLTSLARISGEPGSGELAKLYSEIPEEERFPFSVFAKTMRRVLANDAEEIMKRSPNNGVPRLRGAIASYLARSRGIVVRPDQIIVGAGSEYLYGLIVQMLGRDRVYALEDPSYNKIRRVYEANGASCEMLKLGRSGIHSSELAGSHADVLHVTPFNSYPSGVTASASKRAEYIRWAKERGARIIEDDYDSEFSELTKAEDTLFSLEPRGTVIYINTFSRTIASSMRMGYMVLPVDLAGGLWKKIEFYSCAVPTFEQYVLADLLNSGAFERHINRVRRLRRKNRDGAGDGGNAPGNGESRI